MYHHKFYECKDGPIAKQMRTEVVAAPSAGATHPELEGVEIKILDHYLSQYKVILPLDLEIRRQKFKEIKYDFELEERVLAESQQRQES